MLFHLESQTSNLVLLAAYTNSGIVNCYELTASLANNVEYVTQHAIAS